MTDKSQELGQLQLELIQAFRTPPPPPSPPAAGFDDSSEGQQAGAEALSQPEPEVTEEQTVSIPGEEDLPVRTPTPELLGKIMAEPEFQLCLSMNGTQSVVDGATGPG